MTLSELEKEVPKLTDYTGTMPKKLRQNACIKVYPPGGLIHQKDSELKLLGIVAKGENRVINEFENGKIYMIETNRAIDFIGEVALLANKPEASVTIEALTTNTVIYLPRKEAEEWVNSDTHILRKMAEHTAFKLYRSSYNNGLKLYYPPMFLVADYLVSFYERNYPKTVYAEERLCTGMAGSISLNSEKLRVVTVQKTRERLGEELGMNIKTLDRTIRSMHKEGYFLLVKGKITYGAEEYLRMKEYLSTAKG